MDNYIKHKVLCYSYVSITFLDHYSVSGNMYNNLTMSSGHLCIPPRNNQSCSSMWPWLEVLWSNFMSCKHDVISASNNIQK